nr:hypothetical protein [Paraburkholderia kururiensis]
MKFLFCIATLFPKLRHDGTEHDAGTDVVVEHGNGEQRRQQRANEKTSEKDSPSWTECARRRLTVVGHGGSAHVMQYAIRCGLLNLTRTLLTNVRTLLFVGRCHMHSRQLPQGINRQLALAALHALSSATH